MSDEAPMARRPTASLSLDLDNQWSYMKTHGDPGWESYPSYLDLLVPQVLKVLATAGTRITVFIVGQDAALSRNHDALRLLAAAGHEIGNHSFHHEPWMAKRPKNEIRQEILEAGQAIRQATGRQPLGYRGPGFSWNPDVLDVLAAEGYRYDASTFPSFLGPIARLYYFRKSSLSQADRKARQDLFGGFTEGFRPLKPYFWALTSGRRLLEIPVTTTPVFRMPFHLSYLLYLGRYSGGLMKAYLALALRLCRLTGVAPSFLLHPLDFLGAEQVPQLRFFPGMDLPKARKMKLVNHVLTKLRRQFNLVSVGEHAELLYRQNLPSRVARVDGGST